MASLTFFEFPDPVVWWQLALYYSAIAWGSFVIGCFGVGGGAIFVPLLLFLPKMEVTVAVGTVFLGAAPMAWCRAGQLFYFGRLDIRRALPLMVGASVGALLGQLALPYIPGAIVSFFVAFLAMWAGLTTQRKVMRDRRVARAAAAAKIEKGETSPEEPQEACTTEVVEPSSLREVAAISATDSKAPLTVESDCREGVEGRLGLGALLESFCFCPLSFIRSWPRQSFGGGAAQHPASGDCKEVQTQAIVYGAGTVDGVLPEKPTSSAAASPSSTPSKAMGSNRSSLQVAGMVGIGIIASFLSSISGTGGPLILFPLWLAWDPKVSMKALVAVSSPFSLVFITFSSVGTMMFGAADLGVASIFAVVAVTGSLGGGLLMERMGDSVMKLMVGVVLMVIGSAVAVRTLLSLLS